IASGTGDGTINRYTFAQTVKGKGMVLTATGPTSLGQTASKIAVDFDGALLALKANGDLYRYANGSWALYIPGTPCKELTVGGYLYCTNSSKQLLRYNRHSSSWDTFPRPAVNTLSGGLSPVVTDTSGNLQDLN